MPTYARSLAPNPVPLANLGRLPLYRIRIPPDFLDLLVGAILGNRYVVLSVIGRGGMSVVYKAKEIATGKIVAVKTLRTNSLTDEMVVKRFQREAELLSRLNHPRIVNLHAYGTSARGQPYFVMDFLVGDNLVTVLKREDHLEAERFQDIFVQVCAAIEHAHKHGAIHRDIKPGNIMLTRTRRTTDYVKVVDFGIAKLAEEAQKLTRMGEVWGSPIYMSPEQCMGATIDLRSDIYSLGIVMYECLTGRVPFLGRNYADTMGKQISEIPPPFATIRPDLVINQNLEAIVMMALAKDADNRYQSLTQMRKDLESALSPHPTANTIPPQMSKSQGRLPAMSRDNMAMPARTSGSKIKSVSAGGKREADNSAARIQNATSHPPRSSGGGPNASPASLNANPSQSRSNMRSQTVPDLDKPKKMTGTRTKMEASSIDSNRVRNLVVIAVGSLLLTATVIAVFTHGQSVAAVAAAVIKQLVGPAEDQSGQTVETTTTTTTSTGAEGAEQDPQQALKDWLSPSGQTTVGGPDQQQQNTGIDNSTTTAIDPSQDTQTQMQNQSADEERLKQERQMQEQEQQDQMRAEQEKEQIREQERQQQERQQTE